MPQFPPIINHIHFTFENCEGCEFDFQYFGKFHLENIISSYKRRGVVELIHSFSTFIISLHYSANINNIFEKIVKNNNISWITIKSINNDKTSSLSLNVPWNYQNEYKNSYQQSLINKRGDLFIIISKEEIDRNYYNIEDIDDEYYFDKFVCEQKNIILP